MSFDHWQLCHIIMLLGQLFFSCPLSNIYMYIYKCIYLSYSCHLSSAQGFMSCAFSLMSPLTPSVLSSSFVNTLVHPLFVYPFSPLFSPPSPSTHP